MITMSIIKMTMSTIMITMIIMMFTLTKLSRREADMMAPLLSNGLCGLSEGHHYYYDDDYDDGDQILVWKSCCQMSILGHCQIKTMRTLGHKDMKTRGLRDLDMKI